MKVFASNNNLHAEIVQVFESNDDLKEALKYFEIVGQDTLWNNLVSLIDSDISDDFIKGLICFPDNTQILIKISHELENIDRLDILSDMVSSSMNLDTSEPEIMCIFLKVLSHFNEELFFKYIDDPRLNHHVNDVIKYSKRCNPSLTLEFFIHTNNFEEILNLSFSLSLWEKLAMYLIKSKQAASWSMALDKDENGNLFAKVIELVSVFPDSESASCLIKVIVLKKNNSMLIKIVSALLENNDVLHTNRSLQTIYLITLIEVSF